MRGACDEVTEGNPFGAISPLPFVKTIAAPPAINRNDTRCFMKKKILIIEDEPKICQFLSINFEGEGYEVETAYSGEEGLEKIKTFKPNLLLLDIKLPGVSGWEVCEQIKKNPKYKDIIIVILSAFTQKLDKDKSTSYKVDDFIAKPFEIDDVTKKIKQLLE